MFRREGKVTIRKRGRRWVADYRTLDGRRIREAIPATSTAEARTIARHINDELAKGQWRPADPDRRTVAQAVAEAIKSTGARPETCAGYESQIKHFVQWFADGADPSTILWDDVSPPIVQAYARELENSGASPATIRARWHILRTVSRYMATVYRQDYNDVTVGIRPHVPAVNPHDRQALDQRKALTGPVLDALLAYLSRAHSQLHVVASLQALAGLRVLEAVSLRESDVDRAAGTIRVTETPQHVPKNTFSYRKIPIGPRLLETLVLYIQSLPVRDLHGPIFRTAAGNPWTAHACSRRMRQLIDQAAVETDLAELRGFQGHWLRSTFVTAVRSEGVDTDVVQAYIGHRAETVMGAHYDQKNEDRFRSTIIPAITRFLAGQHKEEIHQ